MQTRIVSPVAGAVLWQEGSEVCVTGGEWGVLWLERSGVFCDWKGVGCVWLAGSGVGSVTGGNGVFCDQREVGCSVSGGVECSVLGGSGMYVTGGTWGDTGSWWLLCFHQSGMHFSRNSEMVALTVCLLYLSIVLNRCEIKSCLIINSLYGPPLPNRYQWKGDRGRLLAARGARKAICQPSSVLVSRSNPSWVLSMAQAKRTHTPAVVLRSCSCESGASECWAEGILILKLNNSSLSPHFGENLIGDIFFVWYLFFCRISFNLCYLLSPVFHWAFTKNKIGEQIADLKADKLWSCRVWWLTASRWTCWSCVSGSQDVVKYIWVAQCCLDVLRSGFQFFQTVGELLPWGM